MKGRHLTAIVWRSQQRLRRRPTRDLLERALPENCRQSGNSALADVWEEFKAQLQGEQSIMFGLFEDTIQGICAEVAAKPARELQQFLWLWTEGYERLWVDQDVVQLTDWEPQDVADELYRRVCDVACDEPMPEGYSEPTDEYPEGG